jgi:starvation-inducible DNA-binding protein
MPAAKLVKEVTKENRADDPVVQHLQREVANAFVLHANYKHYHWQTYGPLFRDIHLMFDEFAQHALESIDMMAERIRMIGQEVRAVQLKELQEAASVESAGSGHSLREMLEQAGPNC